jgi:hypothetical protein
MYMMLKVTRWTMRQHLLALLGCKVHSIVMREQDIVIRER